MRYLDSKLAVGDRVRYSRAFLQSAGIYSGPTAFRAGTLTELPDAGFARVLWDDSDAAATVSRSAIWGAARLHLEPA